MVRSSLLKLPADFPQSHEEESTGLFRRNTALERGLRIPAAGESLDDTRRLTTVLF
jgi:hypothetical protein